MVRRALVGGGASLLAGTGPQHGEPRGSPRS